MPPNVEQVAWPLAWKQLSLSVNILASTAKSEIVGVAIQDSDFRN